MATRNQPINEISALLSGSQVSNPGQMSGATPQAGVGGVDYTGLVNNEYKAKVANQQSMMGGLFGLASSGIGLLSDRRLKRDIVIVGHDDRTGLNIYEFSYKDAAHIRFRGVMADEVEFYFPECVTHDDRGFAMVNYEKLGIEFVELGAVQ